MQKHCIYRGQVRDVYAIEFGYATDFKTVLERFATSLKKDVHHCLHLIGDSDPRRDGMNWSREFIHDTGAEVRGTEVLAMKHHQLRIPFIWESNDVVILCMLRKKRPAYIRSEIEMFKNRLREYRQSRL